MIRADKRRIDRVRQKIVKRGPMVLDFTVLLTEGDIPFIGMNELKLYLPRGLYMAIDSIVGKEVVRINDVGREGIFTGDLNTLFINAKKATKENLSTK